MTAERVGIALIGLGRAGSIHFKNCIGNRRIDLRYLVDYDVNKCQKLIDISFLDGTKVLSPDQLMTALGINKLITSVFIPSFLFLYVTIICYLPNIGAILGRRFFV